MKIKTKLGIGDNLWICKQVYGDVDLTCTMCLGEEKLTGYNKNGDIVEDIECPRCNGRGEIYKEKDIHYETVKGTISIVQATVDLEGQHDRYQVLFDGGHKRIVTLESPTPPDEDHPCLGWDFKSKMMEMAFLSKKDAELHCVKLDTLEQSKTANFQAELCSSNHNEEPRPILKKIIPGLQEC